MAFVMFQSTYLYKVRLDEDGNAYKVDFVSIHVPI